MPTTNSRSQPEGRISEGKTDLYAKHPERVAELTALMEQLVSKGRSTPGPAQKNDVPVNWKRFLGATQR